MNLHYVQALIFADNVPTSTVGNKTFIFRLTFIAFGGKVMENLTQNIVLLTIRIRIALGHQHEVFENMIGSVPTKAMQCNAKQSPDFIHFTLPEQLSLT